MGVILNLGPRVGSGEWAAWWLVGGVACVGLSWGKMVAGKKVADKIRLTRMAACL